MQQHWLGLKLGKGLGLGLELELGLHYENMEVGRIFQVRQIFHDTGTVSDNPIAR